MKVIAFLSMGLYLFLQVAWEGCYLEPLQTKLCLLLSFTAQVIQTISQFLERDVHLGASSHPGLRHPGLFSYYERLSYYTSHFSTVLGFDSCSLGLWACQTR